MFDDNFSIKMSTHNICSEALLISTHNIFWPFVIIVHSGRFKGPFLLVSILFPTAGVSIFGGRIKSPDTSL